MAANKDKMQTPSVLSFTRKLDLSDGLFRSGVWEDRENGQTWKTVPVLDKTVRGTISNRPTSTKKTEEEVLKANIQTVDFACLSYEHDTLSLQFTCKILSDVGKPSACDIPNYQKKMEKKVAEYINKNVLTELATRYAVNLANARYLWRNRFGAEEIEVCVQRLEKGKVIKDWKFNGYDFSLNDFAVPDNAKVGISELAEVIVNGFSGELVILKVTAYARIGGGQEVYPSEEFIQGKGNTVGAKSKTLYSVNGVAGFHSQKNGNSIRTIDTWYEGGNSARPIAVEPYGSVTSQGKAHRASKNDFYTMIDMLMIKDKEFDKLEDLYFFIAILIRGGVFSGKKEK